MSNMFTPLLVVLVAYLPIVVVGGGTDSCLLTTCEKVVDIKLATDKIISKQGYMANELKEISDIILDVNETISYAEEFIQNVVSTSETTVLGAISSSKAAVETTIGNSQTSVTSSISSSQTIITGAISTSESSLRAAILAGEETIESAISSLESNLRDKMSTSASNMTRSLSASESTITRAISSSESSVVNAIIDKLDNDVIPNIKCPPMTESECFIKSSNVQVFHIELDIFSGVANPTWAVNSSSSDFASVKGVLTQATSTSLPSLAGYRGFIVTTRFYDGTQIEQRFGRGRQPSTTIEIVLLNSNDGTLSSDVINMAFAGINNLPPPDIGSVSMSDSVMTGLANGKCRKREPCQPPGFDTAPWMSVADNSYNYAVQKSTGTFAQPGRAGGAQYSTIDGNTLRAACVMDAICDMPNPPIGMFPTDNNCLIALTIIPGVDFHFYRRDSNGSWSHKPGPRLPTNLDNSGNSISDPRTADIAPYKYAGFLSVCPKKNSVI